jgi:outer membrane protein OmpA-like peptidoglycan-associated protein
LPFNQNNSDACHPSISIDGDKLYFSSNREGGYGGMDLYVCERVNGNWSKPRNLGSKINTAKNEIFPYIHADGTLFYSSDGLQGNGGLDIFYAISKTTNLPNNRTYNGFSAPINLGTSFNSDKDDFGFIIDLDMKNGYFTSNRSGGIGSDDIYSFNINEGTLFEHLIEKNSVVNSQNTQPNSATNTKKKNNSSINTPDNEVESSNELINLIVIDRQTGKPIPMANAAYLNLNELSILDIIADNNGNKQTPFIKSDGTFALELVASKMANKQTNTGGKAQLKTDKDGNYVISVSKDGYLPEQVTLKKDAIRDDIVVLLSRPSKNFTLKEGMLFKLKNVYYNYNDASIRPDAAKDLDALFTIMTKYPDIEVELGSHTDARGTDDYNLELSQRRADNAVQYLVNRGIDPQRIVAKGYGETHLRNHCGNGVPCSENEHKINRRTEVKITKSGNIEGQISTDYFTPETGK